MYYDFKEIKFKIRRGGGIMASSYSGSIGFKRPTSQFEANKMAEEWLKQKYPGCEILDLQVILK